MGVQENHRPSVMAQLKTRRTRQTAMQKTSTSS